MRLHQSLFLLVAVASSVFAQDLKPVADRLAAQNALFEEQYESDLRNFPERATAFGDYRYNDKLAEYSLDAIAQRHKTDEAFLARLEAIPTTGFSDQDQLSHDLLVRVLQQRIADFDLKEYEMPINQQNGIHTSLADLPLSVPFDSVKHYEDYIARLHQIPRVLSQTTEVLRAGMKDKLMPVRFLLEKLPVQCQGIIDADPFLLPTKKYPADISPEDQKRLTQQITDAINTDVIPAYKTFAAFLRTEYAPQGRTTLSVTSLPDGQKRYENDIYARTTTHMTPDEIHQLGLREIDRIQAEMTAIAKKEGFADLASFRASLKTNPKYIPTSAGADPRRFPPLHRPDGAETSRALHAASEVAGHGRSHTRLPGRRCDPLRHRHSGRQAPRPRRRRHLQLRRALADRRRGDRLPRRHPRTSHAAIGAAAAHGLAQVPSAWSRLQRLHRRLGLYAEQLGKEVGFYQDPVSDYGRLSSELFRAVRLVVDTGIHSKGWTRDQVVDFFRKSGAVDEPTIQSETDRYIAWPAQALSYKLGQLKIPRTPRPRPERIRPQVRHPQIPRRDARRRNPPSRSARGPHG